MNKFSVSHNVDMTGFDQCSETTKKIWRGELLVLTNLKGEISLKTPEEYEMYQAKQMQALFDNSFTSQYTM